MKETKELGNQPPEYFINNIETIDLKECNAEYHC